MTNNEIMSLATETYKQGFSPAQYISMDLDKRCCCFLSAACYAKTGRNVATREFQDVLNRSPYFINGTYKAFDGMDNSSGLIKGSRRVAYENGYKLGLKARKKFLNK